MVKKIVVGKGSCGIAAGAGRISELIERHIAENGLGHIETAATGCIGMCYLEPIVDVYDGSGAKKTYVKVAPKDIDRLFAFSDSGLMESGDAEALAGQKRIALRNCGRISPEDISEYISAGGYKAIEKCLANSPEWVISQIKTSGLRGRGGAGFPTWFKWEAARNSPGNKKYIICNADEGDPGAFMDRSIMEGDPHTLIEGMMIGAYAIGADEGVIYVRAEYPLAIVRAQNAIRQAERKGLLGENILGSGFGFALRIKAGAGAFVCGEETALIASLEGERGMPRLKPPFPAQKGYWQKPSNINNVETFANVPWIISNGGAAFGALGTEESRGTKVFALTGKIKKGGLVEIPMGMTVRDVIFGVGGGIKDGKAFKAVQMGGPSGGCIPGHLLDTPIEYASLNETGAIMGSGGMVVMDGDTCMVDMARFFFDFTRKESCGKCTHCRIGTKRMLEILERICAGGGREGDIELLEELAGQVKDGSLCALGQTAPNPVLTTVKYFRNEYEDHIYRKKCTAKQCKPLLSYGIDAEKCKGCTLCAMQCPAGAVSGGKLQPHAIDAEKCIKCGKCAAACRFGAVTVS